MNLLKTTAFIALLTVGVTANSTTTNPISSSSIQTQSAETKRLSQREADLLIDRVYEIHSMDLKALNNAEKRALREELASINEQLHHPAGGVYISVGGLILILILLIILF